MPQTVYKLSQDTINQMKKHYAKFLTTPPQGAVFRAKTPEAVITAYKSGKVMFQGAAPDKASQKWVTEAVTSYKSVNHKRQPSAHGFAPDPTLFAKSHIGTDEAGTGDYFGPITVAGVYLNKQQIQQLQDIGVTDSKALTDAKIRQLASTIMKLQIPYSLLILHNEKYNQLQKKGWSQGKMKAMLHQHVIGNLVKKIGNVSLEGIVIDQFCEPAIYQRHIRSENLSLISNTYFLTKAESYSTPVAAGSIIARASFLKEMDSLSEQVGIELPKGASKKVDQTIAKIINANGESILHKLAKTHFANTKKARNYL